MCVPFSHAEKKEEEEEEVQVDLADRLGLNKTTVND
jgi:hypothetical protein